MNLHRNLASAVNGVRWVDAYSSDVAHSDAVVVDILQDNKKMHHPLRFSLFISFGPGLAGIRK